MIIVLSLAICTVREISDPIPHVFLIRNRNVNRADPCFAAHNLQTFVKYSLHCENQRPEDFYTDGST